MKTESLELIIDEEGKISIKDSLRIGSLCWVNTEIQNPQQKSNELVGQVERVLSLDTFESDEYGTNQFVKVEFTNADLKDQKLKVGYVEEVIKY